MELEILVKRKSMVDDEEFVFMKFFHFLFFRSNNYRLRNYFNSLFE